jgi:hypothetical protein
MIQRKGRWPGLRSLHCLYKVDRTGQDRTGQDRTGQDGTGRDRTSGTDSLNCTLNCTLNCASPLSDMNINIRGWLLF